MIANEVEPEMTTIEAIPEVTTSVAEPEITEKAETSSHFESDDQQESALNEGENLSVLSTIELGDENSFISVLVSYKKSIWTNLAFNIYIYLKLKSSSF